MIMDFSSSFGNLIEFPINMWTSLKIFANFNNLFLVFWNYFIFFQYTDQPFVILDVINDYLLHNINIYYTFVSFNYSHFNLNEFNNFMFIKFINFFNTFIFLLFLNCLFFKLLFDKYSILMKNLNKILLFYEQTLLVWINFIFIKFESYEEALCIFVLWPWCIFLIFSHFFMFDNSELYLIFIEWGLPLLYGYFLLIEYLCLFSIYFFVYLTGTRNRNIFLITLIEDILNFVILFARITLQVIRGLICGFFHDFFRELNDIFFSHSHHIFILNNFINFSFNFFFITIIFYGCAVYLLSFTLFFIYFILFLQLFFLLLVIWLFVRCWFISFSCIINKTWKNLFF